LANLFDFHRAIQLAESIRSAPPARSFIERPTLLDTLVLRIAFPSDICLADNRRSRKGFVNASFAIEGVKDKLWACICEQVEPWRRYQEHWPLRFAQSERVQVVACKFSSVAPDVGANFAKQAIDMLTLPRRDGQKRRLGIIEDDRPACVQQIHYWEFLPRAEHAFVLLEVRL
jgi:hypothetical protein